MVSCDRPTPEPIETLRDELELLRQVLDLSVEGLQVVDARGIITLVNDSFLKIHQLTRAQAEGRPVTEVIENTRMHLVARTGVAELDEIQKIHGHDYVVSRIPVFQDGQCLGAVGKIVFQDFRAITRLAVRTRRLQLELEALRQSKAQARADTRFSFADIVAEAEPSRLAKEKAMMAAPTPATVLLLGESGVGKEVFAQAIHNLSPRYSRPFVRVNCPAITESLFESELFGYADGAFTGARKGGRAGKFELADTGTIFLDEIGDMPLAAQAKLLRVLQEGTFEPVGSDRTVTVDVRILAATNQDLEEAVREGRFRADLFYRLDVFPLKVPPLRERREDIVLLAEGWLYRQALRTGLGPWRIPPGQARKLEAQDWTGNVRELINVLERATILTPQGDLELESALRPLEPGSATLRPDGPKGSLRDLERQAILEALGRSGGKVYGERGAALALGLKPTTLQSRMKKLGISRLTRFN